MGSNVIGETNINRDFIFAVIIMRCILDQWLFVNFCDIFEGKIIKFSPKNLKTLIGSTSLVTLVYSFLLTSKV
jgi:hypothetical protein